MAYDATDFAASQSQMQPVTANAATEAQSLLSRDPESITEPKERLMYLRDFLRQLPPERFDMSDFLYRKDGDGCYEGSATAYEVAHNCQTAACIAGWAHVKFEPAEGGFSDDIAAPLLGLDEDRAAALFFPSATPLPSGDSAYLATPTQAANVLDHLIRTGEVDWSKA